MRNSFVLLFVLVLGGESVVHAANVPRFSAQLANGTRIEGQQLQDWHANGAQPKIDGKPILEGDKAFRWLRDRSLLPAAPPKAYIEMIGGDRLPCTVDRYVPAVTNAYDPEAACFHVAPEGLVEEPRDQNERGRRKSRMLTPQDEVRVLERFVRRIVWQARGPEQYEPGTIFFRDGRQLSFRSARFGEETVYLLLADGQQKAQFREIAELHLPLVDPWGAYYDELAVLSPDLKSRLFQVETTSGLVVTASRTRFYCRPSGGDRDFERWIHGLQPAWSPDMLWIPSNQIAMRRTFAPHEAPLTRLVPTSAVQKSLLAGSGAPPQVNRNVQRGPLITAGGDYGSGFGVHATSELHFPLPACVKAFRAGVAIDRAAGAGGCIRARVFANDTKGKPLWESGYLQGGQPPADTGALALGGPAAGQKELVLYVDPAHEGRPGGADPLDIRDLTDWLEPMLELDQTKLAAEVAKRQGKQVPAWQGWTVKTEPGAEVKWVNVWDEARREPDRYVSAVQVEKQPLRLARELTPGPNDRWLIVAADRMAHTGGSPPKIEVRFDGVLMESGTAPTRNRDLRDPRLFAIPLPNGPERSPSKPIVVEISQVPGGDVAPVYWHTICMKPQRPALFEIFDEVPGELLPVDPATKATGEVINTDHFQNGVRCLKISAGGAYKLKLPSPVSIRERPEWGEYRYLHFAVKKKGGGRFGLAFATADASAKTPVFDGGSGPPVHENSRRVFPNSLPADWVVITRDLYTDLGDLDLESLTLLVPDGEFVEFDAIFLGRTDRDFGDIQPQPYGARKK